jgi:ribosomal protein S18 acetylase RimI-like enzyme
LLDLQSIRGISHIVRELRELGKDGTCSMRYGAVSTDPRPCGETECFELADMVAGFSVFAGAKSSATPVHPEDGEMFLLFAHPASAGRGIGRTLLSAAHDALRAAGCRQAYLYVHEQNERALAVHESAGYRPAGSIRESDFGGTAIRELRLAKQL